MKKSEHEILENYKTIEEIADNSLMLSLRQFIQSKIEYLERKCFWLLSNNQADSEYQVQIVILKRILTNVNKNLEDIIEMNQFLKSFGSNVKNYRLEKNLQLEELSEKSYFNTEELMAIENGEYYINNLYDLNHISLLIGRSLREIAGKDCVGEENA